MTERRTKSVGVRFTPDEHAAVKAAAWPFSMAGWIHDQAVAAAAKPTAGTATTDSQYEVDSADLAGTAREGTQ